MKLEDIGINPTDYWIKEINKITERCDFNGLLQRNSTSFEQNNNITKWSEKHKKNATTFKFTFPDSFYANLQQLSSKDLPLESILHFGWAKVLSVYGNGNQTVLANATHPCNLLPVILDHSHQSPTCLELIQTIKSQLNNQHPMNVDSLQEGMFDSLISWRMNGHGGSPYNRPPQIPTALTFHETRVELQLSISYDEELFDEPILQDFMDVMMTLLQQLFVDIHISPLALEYLPPSQKEKIFSWQSGSGSDNSKEFPSEKRLHHLFEEAVERSPDKVAIINEDVRLTYMQLNKQANRFARYLRNSLSIQPEQLIGLFLEKSELMMIVVLGVWKSGAAYIPIDPTYPDERVRFILGDTGTRFILTNSHHRARFLDNIIGEQRREQQLQVIGIEDVLQAVKDTDPSNLDTTHLRSTQLAYVTYTSGTTGVPKGVYKEHRGVVNSITDLGTKYGMREGVESVVLFSAYVFEPFVRQSLIALLNCQELVLIRDDEKLDPIKFPQFLRTHGITYVNGTGSVLQEYDFSECPSLKKLILVGEDLTETRYAKLRSNYKGRIINEYGFTESALVTAIKSFESPEDERKDRSIGRPLRNVNCYILNKGLKPLPIGAIGELYIGGVGVSPRGYFNRPQLTSERFMCDPFQTEEGEGSNGVMYKTGDLARWLPSGEVEYIGRNDFQIKLRGIRIEPGEIEWILSKYPGVERCVVAAKGEMEKTLVGYFVSSNSPPSAPTEEELLRHLEAHLPRYMIPSRLIQIQSIPVTINGKVDLRALPEVGVGIGRCSDAIGPRNSMDATLCKIWSDALGVSGIGIKDDFFRLGGHSISCIQVIGRIRAQLGQSVKVDEIFSLRTIENLSNHLEKKRSGGNGEESGKFQNTRISQRRPEAPTSPLGKEIEIESCLLANSLQQGLMYHYLKQSSVDDAYIMQSLYDYRTTLCSATFKKAWEAATLKYPSLRLRFIGEREVLQIVDKAHPQSLDWRFVDLSEKGAAAVEEELKQLQARDRQERYRLEAGRLFRVYLIKRAEAFFSLLFSCHHIILDGWSFKILFAFVHQTYVGLLDGRVVEMNVAEPYLAAQQYLESHRKDNVPYWTKEISQILQRPNLSGLQNEPTRYSIQLSDYDHVQEQREMVLTLPGPLTSELRDICSTHAITLHSILQFVWHKVLHVYGGGASHTVVGTTVSGRNIPIDNIEHSVGLFINTLPLVVDHDVEVTVLGALRKIQEKANAMNERSNVELGQLQKGELKHSLFDSLFVLENYPNLEKDKVQRHNEALGFEWKFDVEKLDYPLAVVAREGGGGENITFSLCYAGELFEEERIKEVLQLVLQLLQQLTMKEKLGGPVTGLDIITPEHLALINSWNRMDGNISGEEKGEKTLHQIFEEQVLNFPEKVAVIYERSKLSYTEMNRRCNQLAHHLRTLLPPRPNQLIALFMDKSELLILSIFGVWKCGAAYVPIDPSYPDDRVVFILEDTGAKIIITNRIYSQKLEALVNSRPTAAASIQVLGIEEILPKLEGLDVDNPAPISNSRDLAYVIYTSGTTGKPKGVMIEHRGVVNLQASLSQLFSLKYAGGNENENLEVLLSFSNFVFDHFVEQMTDALLNGQTLLVLNDEMRGDKGRLYTYMRENRVTYLSGTPSVLSMYEYGDIPSLTRIDGVGEDFTEALFNKIRSTFGGLIINGYGPTEISITSHKRLYPPGQRRTDKSIGRQVGNTGSYVLNKEMKMVPIGAVGELYIGGLGVSRGYLNREDLTSQRFIDNPYQSEGERGLGINGKIYKTGDLVRFLPNGELEYLGRNDFQVKVRGLRMELSEIEGVLLSYPGITHAVVVAREYGGNGSSYLQKIIVGYYVADTVLEEQDIKRFMQSKLLQYMIPQRVVRIERIPVTINGKVDTKQLPHVDFSPREDIVSPRTEGEKELCRIWAELLHIPMEQVGVLDDWFSLGGDSLLAISLSFMISKAFGRTVGVAQIFKLKTIQQLAECIERDADAGLRMSVGDNSKPEDQGGGATAFVSFAQERLLFIDELEGGTDAFNIPIFMKLGKGVELEALKKALLSVLMRQSGLRTIFPRGKEEGKFRVQQVLSLEETLNNFRVREFSLPTPIELDAELVKVSKHIFSLESELPVIMNIYKVVGAESYLAMVFHHICFDGWSWGIFQRDLEAFYAFHKNSVKIQLPPLPLQYKEFAAWERKQLIEERLRGHGDYWLQKLEGAQSLNLLPNLPRPQKFQYGGRDVRFHLGRGASERLKILAKHMKVSLFSVLVSAFCVTLRAFTNQQELLIGTPVANRGATPELEHLVGFFVNLLVLKIRVHPNSTLSDLVRSVSEEIIQSTAHQEYTFEKIVKQLKVENDLSRHPIVQVLFSLAPNAVCNISADGQAERLEMSTYETIHEQYTTAKYDLSATMSEGEEGLIGNFNFATCIFNESTVRSLMDTFHRVLKQFSKIEDMKKCKVAQIQFIDKESIIENVEKEDALKFPSDCNVDDRKAGTTLSHIFEQCVQASPKEIAIIFNNTRLTYEELNAKANQLAHYLKSLTSINPDDLIALCLEKSELLIIAILAVWKCGAAYVPIDPDNYPLERIKFILKDTDAKLLISNEFCQKSKKIQETSNKLLLLQVDSLSTKTALAEQSSLNLACAATENNLAYVIYTSGTTGKPKGVMIEHKGLLNFRNNLMAQHPEKQSVLFLSNYVFDFSIEQFVLSFLNSNTSTLVIPPNPKDHFMDSEFYEYSNDHKVSYLSGTPTFIHQLDLSKLTFLRSVTVAGEAFNKPHFDKIRKEYAGCLINAYGVTETSVYNSMCRFEKEDGYKNCLGSFMSNMKVYLMNEELQLLPQGAVGELYLSGPCLARGYLNQPELTAKHFLSNPNQTEHGEKNPDFSRIYKTGDLARSLPNGEFEYLGRNDEQVKIRGLRVELGEIEAVLGAHPEVEQTAVIAKYDEKKKSAKYIVGYYVSSTTSPTAKGPRESELIEFLQRQLPLYMIPSRLIRIQGPLPLTINGKLDTRSLPSLDFTTGKSEAIVPPRNTMETQLCQIWEGLLCLQEGFGINDDFFQLGGDSITSLQLVSQIRNKLSHKITVKDVFVHRTIRRLCEHLQDKVVGVDDRVAGVGCIDEQGLLVGEVPLLPIQKWFLAKNLPSPHNWNQSFFIKTPQLDIARLRGAIQALEIHHDAFRLRFKRKEGQEEQGWSQFYDENATGHCDLDSIDVRDLRDEEELQTLFRKLQSHFDLEKGPLSNFLYIHGYEDGSARIWCAMHHLIVDTVSWRIISKDLQILYNGGKLGNKGTSYRQWGQAAEKYIICQEEKQYWERIIENVSSFNQALLNQMQTSSDPGTNTFSLTLDQTDSILRHCNELYNTKINDLLLSAFAHALKELTGKGVHFVTVESHGREEFGDGLNVSDTVGWFTSQFPFRIETGKDVRSTILKVKKSREEIPKNGVGYGINFGYMEHQLPNISFNYLGQFDSKSEFWKLTDVTGEYDLERGGTDLMDATAVIFKGKMRLQIVSKLSKRQAEEFMVSFKHYLGQVIEATLTPHNQHFEPYFELNSEASTILFILPPGEGGAESYFNNIVPKLNKFRLVLFNNIYLQDKNLYSSFEELAKFYINYVRAVQAEGPYNFLGWSFGGVLSLEIARQLSLEGEEIHNLMFIDSYFNVMKAVADINREDSKEDIIDKINFSYAPNLMQLLSTPVNIVMFKASLLNDMYTSEDQLLFYEYYKKTRFNNLETLIDPMRIQLCELKHDNHGSWVKNEQELDRMAGVIIASMLNETNSVA